MYHVGVSPASVHQCQVPRRRLLFGRAVPTHWSCHPRCGWLALCSCSGCTAYLSPLFMRNLGKWCPLRNRLAAVTSSKPGQLKPAVSLLPHGRLCFYRLQCLQCRVAGKLRARSTLLGRPCHIWQRMPMYSQYIREQTLQEVYAHSLQSIQSQRGLDIPIEQASRLPLVLGYTTILPLAVACQFLHFGCGLPAIFAFNLFQACLASCQRKELAVTLWADWSQKHNAKARWWACPTGDPNAGKSPICSCALQSIKMACSQTHWTGVFKQQPHPKPSSGFGWSAALERACVQAHIGSGTCHPEDSGHSQVP